MKVEKEEIFNEFCLSFFLSSVAVATLVLCNVTEGKPIKETLLLLHNACFATGGLGVLVTLSAFTISNGGWIGVGYVVKSVGNALAPFPKEKLPTYAQYRQRQVNKKQKKRLGVLGVGLLYIAISLLLLGVWYRV